MREPHLYLLALTTGLLEGLRIGQRPDAVTHILIDVAGDLAHDRCRALWLQRAGRAVALIGPVVDNVALIDVAGAGELRAAWANIDVALLVEDEVGSAEGAIGTRRLVPHRNMGRDLVIHQPRQQPHRTINSIAREPLGPKLEAARDAVHHRLSDGDLLYAIGARAFGVDDDSDLVVDQVVRIVGEERIHALPCDPRRLRVGQRKFLGRFASLAAAARTVAISTTALLIPAGSSIEGREVLSNGTGCHLRLRPSNRLVARSPLMLVHIRLNQARIDRERFAADEPGRDAHRYHALEYTAQSIALAEPLVPRATEHRMIGNLVLDAELAKPPVGQIDLHLRAEPPLRADRKHVAHDQHPDHQHRVDRGATRV